MLIRATVSRPPEHRRDVALHLASRPTGVTINELQSAFNQTHKLEAARTLVYLANCRQVFCPLCMHYQRAEHEGIRHTYLATRVHDPANVFALVGRLLEAERESIPAALQNGPVHRSALCPNSRSLRNRMLAELEKDGRIVVANGVVRLADAPQERPSFDSRGAQLLREHRVDVQCSRARYQTNALSGHRLHYLASASGPPTTIETLALHGALGIPVEAWSEPPIHGCAHRASYSLVWRIHRKSAAPELVRTHGAEVIDRYLLPDRLPCDACDGGVAMLQRYDAHNQRPPRWVCRCGEELDVESVASHVGRDDLGVVRVAG